MQGYTIVIEDWKQTAPLLSLFVIVRWHAFTVACFHRGSCRGRHDYVFSH